MTSRRRLSLVGVLVGTSLLTAGVVVAARGATHTDGPATVVRKYFAALAQGDAAQALAYGDVPGGPRRLLTSAVLREQQRIAPFEQVEVGAARTDGHRATVPVRYSLGFAGGAIPTSASVALRERDGEWRIAHAAIRVAFTPSTARDRLSVLGAPVPVASTLLFPGALPIRVDTPYLELVRTLAYVSFGTPRALTVPVRVSPAGETAVRRAIRAALTKCLDGPSDVSCPLPTGRYVPGSLRGTLNGALGGLVDLDQHDPAGLLTYAGTPTVTGSWRRLTFRNVPRHERAQVQLDVRASGYAVAPLVMRWTH